MQGNEDSELLETVVKFYGKMRQQKQLGLVAIDRKFSEVQHQIIQIVQMRKDKEKQIQMQQLKQGYEDVIMGLVHKIEAIQNTNYQYLRLMREKEEEILALRVQVSRLEESRRIEQEIGRGISKINEVEGSVRDLRMWVGRMQVEGVQDVREQVYRQDGCCDSMGYYNGVGNLAQDKIEILNIREQMKEENQKIESMYVSQLKNNLNIYAQLIQNNNNKHNKNTDDNSNDNDGMDLNESYVRLVRGYEEKIGKVQTLLEQEIQKNIKLKLEIKNEKLGSMEIRDNNVQMQDNIQTLNTQLQGKQFKEQQLMKEIKQLDQIVETTRKCVRDHQQQNEILKAQRQRQDVIIDENRQKEGSRRLQESRKLQEMQSELQVLRRNVVRTQKEKELGQQRIGQLQLQIEGYRQKIVRVQQLVDQQRSKGQQLLLRLDNIERQKQLKRQQKVDVQRKQLKVQVDEIKGIIGRKVQEYWECRGVQISAIINNIMQLVNN